MRRQEWAARAPPRLEPLALARLGFRGWLSYPARMPTPSKRKAAKLRSWCVSLRARAQHIGDVQTPDERRRPKPLL